MKILIFKKNLIDRLLDWIMTIVIFITATELFRVLGFIFGFKSVAPITVAIAIFSSIYLLMNYRLIPLKNNRIIFWGIIIVLIPFVSALYSPINAIREIALQLYYLVIILSSSIYFKTGKRKSLLHAILIVASVGAIISIIKPDLFESFADIASGKSSFDGRAFGLYLQPNKCAENFIWILLMYIVSENIHKGFFKKIIFWIILLIIILTGSRGGLIVFLYISMVVYIFKRPYILNKINLIRLLSALIFFFVFIIICLLFREIIMEQSKNKEPINRFEVLIKPSEILNSESVLIRFESQKKYLSLLFNERIFWGYGFGAAAYYRKTNLLGSHAAHNQIIENLFAFGIFGLFSLSISGIVLWNDLLKLSTKFNVPIHLLILGSIFLFFFVSNTILGTRNLYILIGFLYAKSYNPNSTFERAKTFQRPCMLISAS